MGQGSGQRSCKAAPQASNCPPASPTGAAGCPAAGRAVDGGDIPPSCQWDRALEAAGGHGLRRRRRPGKPACAAA